MRNNVSFAPKKRFEHEAFEIPTYALGLHGNGALSSVRVSNLDTVSQQRIGADSQMSAEKAPRLLKLNPKA